MASPARRGGGGRRRTRRGDAEPWADTTLTNQKSSKQAARPGWTRLSCTSTTTRTIYSLLLLLRMLLARVHSVVNVSTLKAHSTTTRQVVWR